PNLLASTAGCRFGTGHMAQGRAFHARDHVWPIPHSSGWHHYCDELSARCGRTPSGPAHYCVVTDAVDRVRSHGLLDGRFSPLLRAAENLGIGERADDLIP